MFFLANALGAEASIFRVHKFVVNGQPEYYSPDKNAPAIATDREGTTTSGDSDLRIVELLGGGESVSTAGRFKCYRLNDGTIIHIKRSRFYPNGEYYWYGINAGTLVSIDQYGVTHVVFVMGDEGLVKVPVAMVKEFVRTTRASRNPDGTVRHYHCLISPGPQTELYWSSEVPRFPLAGHYVPF